jgi:hypothetical protein
VTPDSHRPPRPRCAINPAAEVPGDPWSMLVLGDVIFGNRRPSPELRVRAKLLRDDGFGLIERFIDELRDAHPYKSAG